jgi:hypothetical protein
MSTTLQRLVMTLAMAFFALASFAGPRPAFENFPSVPEPRKQRPKLQLLTHQDRELRSALAAASRQPVNFAGHHVLASIGCGASCVMPVVIDVGAGIVTWLPFTMCCRDSAHDTPLEFRRDSELLVIRGQRNEEGPAGPHYYRFKQGRFFALH